VRTGWPYLTSSLGATRVLTFGAGEVISTTVEPSSNVAIQSPRWIATGGAKVRRADTRDRGRNSGASGTVMLPTPQPAAITTRHGPRPVDRRKIIRSFRRYTGYSARWKGGWTRSR